MENLHLISKGLMLSVLLGFVLPATAEVVLPPHFTDNMVLQQRAALHIKGKAGPQRTVTVRAGWSRTVQTVCADAEGRFTVSLKTPKAGGPYTITFNDGTETALHNVLVGEVWLGGGQSNMDMDVNGWAKVLDYEQEVANANYPEIRLLEIGAKSSLHPLEEVEVMHGGWRTCSSESVKDFSACCYFFARKLWQELHVPIGVIDDCVGGTSAEKWMRTEVVASIKGFEEKAQSALQMTNVMADSIINAYDSISAARDRGSHVCGRWFEPALDDSEWPTMTVPTHIEDYLGQVDGAVWMRKHISLPPHWAGKSVTISLGIIDDANITYWNGEEIGRLNCYPEKATYTIPASMVASDNVVCVRVLDTDGGGGMIDEPELLFLAQGNEKISLAGDWRYQMGVELNELPQKPQPYNNVSCLWNGMIAPLTDFPLRGVIWYQGCANVGRAEQYVPLFQALIQDWRAQFGQSRMPFYFVQLASFLAESDLQPDSEWAALREAQAKACSLKGVEMTSAIDIGDAGDIHPRNKQEVGLRLALLALRHGYGKPVVCSAPRYKGYYVRGDEVHIRFGQPKWSEPFLPSDNLPGFIIAGDDGMWHVAKAHTQGDEVVVTSDEVPHPAAVRYGWADNPKCMLHTSHHLPVFPFRTDQSELH